MIWRLFLTSLLVLFCPMIFGELIVEPTLVPRFTMVSILLAVISIWWIKSKKSIILPDKKLSAFLIGFYLIHLISVFWALNFADALFESQKIFLGLAFLVFILNYEFEEEKLFEILGYAFLLVNLYELGELFIFKLPKLFGHINLLCSYLFLTLPFSVIIFIKKGFKNKVLGGLNILIALVFIVVVGPKSSLLGILVSATAFGFIYFLWKRDLKLRLRLFKVSAIIFFISIFSFSWIAAINNELPLFQQAPDSVKERFVLWEKSTQLIQDEPFGVGAGNWQYNYARYGVSDIETSKNFDTVFRRPHNDFFWVLTETGYLGFAILLGFIFLFAKRIENIILENRDISSLLLFSTLVGLMCISIFSFPRERIIHILLTSIILALLVKRSAYQWKIIKGRFIFIPVLILGLGLNITIGVYRVIGEYHTQVIYGLLDKKEPSKIVEHSKAALSPFYMTDPTCTPVYTYMGVGYNGMNLMENLKSVNEKAYLLSPYNYKTLANYGYVLERLHYSRTAEKLLLESNRINSHYEQTKINLAVLYLNRKDYQNSKKWLFGIDDYEIKYPEITAELAQQN